MNTKTLVMGIINGGLLLSLSSYQNGTKCKSSQQKDSVSAYLASADIAISFPTSVTILFPAKYRKESPGYPKGVYEKDWYEIYKDGKSGNWNIGKAELVITYGPDECVDEDVMTFKSRHKQAILFLGRLNICLKICIRFWRASRCVQEGRSFSG